MTRVSRKNRTLTFVAGLSEVGRIIYQLSIAGALVMAYFLFKTSNPLYIATWLDTGLLVLNGVAFIVSIFGIIVSTVFYGDPKKKK